jgi:hypothetical protein
MNAYEGVFRSIASDVEVQDEHSFAHRDLGVLRPTVEMDTQPASQLRDYLWRFLYLQYYACDAQAAQVLLDGSELVVALPDWEDPEFVARVAAAHRGRGYFTQGWRVVALDDRVRVQRHGLTLTAGCDEIRASQPLRVGACVDVRFPPYMRYVQPRWYMIVSDAGPCEREDGPLVRSYFTVTGPDVVPELVAALTGCLNAAEAVFQLKVLNSPEAYCRRDPVVLYLHRQTWKQHRLRLARVHESFAARLRPDGPCFAQELGRGWRLADEPEYDGPPVSFGQHRCMLVAEGLVQARRAGAADADGRYRAIVERYRTEGLDIRHPYRNAVSAATP